MSGLSAVPGLGPRLEKSERRLGSMGLGVEPSKARSEDDEPTVMTFSAVPGELMVF
jgi:hypothetical protein